MKNLNKELLGSGDGSSREDEKEYEIIKGCVYEDGEYRLDLHGGVPDGKIQLGDLQKYLDNIFKDFF